MLTAFTALLLSSSAFAQAQAVPCQPEDYKLLFEAIDSKPVIKGAELRTDVRGMLTEETGPTCRKFVSGRPSGPSIPGMQFQKFELSSGGRRYGIEITISFDRKDVRVYLSRL